MSKRIATVGLFIALAMIFSYIEAILPLNIGIPGVKLGIANIVVVVALYRLGIKEAAVISAVRILLMGLLFGNLASLWYSFAGGLLSFVGMVVCKRLKLSVIGVSAVGGVLHNFGQLAAAAILLNSVSVGYYLPILQISGLVTGLLIGAASHYINKALDRYSASKPA